MLNPVNIALSGLQAASKRVAVSASNIANQSSTTSLSGGQVVNQPYVAQRVDQVSLSGGGVQAITRDVNPSTVPFFDPSNPSADENGIVNLPNVDTATELVNQKIATYDYQANLSVLKTQDEIEQSLLDILS